MRNWLWIVFAGLAGLLVVAACSGDGGGPPFSAGSGGSGGSGGITLTCDTLNPPPPDCDKPCTSDSQCEASFCENRKCVAYCTAEEGCGVGSTCDTRRGRCIPDVGTGGAGGSGNTNGCQSVEITPTRSIPNVMFLVDQSGSMPADFGGGENRWEAAHTAINGIVSGLESIVRFGLTTYTSRNGFQAGRACPVLPTQIDFALDNASTIGNDSLYPYTYPDDAGEDTPTGDSIDALVSQLLPELSDDDPTIIVLATDGLPDSCECADGWPNPIDNGNNYCEGPPTPTDPRDEAVTAAAAAHAAGIDVFPLWVGDLSDNPADPTRSHMQDVANAGVDGTGTVWVGDDPTSLSVAFESIIGASISCDIQMDERFDDKIKACNEGDVRLDGNPIPCSETNGWRVKPGVDDVIELVGSACDTLKSGDVTFSAEFPCGAIVVE